MVEVQEQGETVLERIVTPTTIVYMGNLALFDDSLVNTGESFLLLQKRKIVSEVEVADGSVILITRTNGWYSLAVSTLPPSAYLIELEGAALISFGNEGGTDNYGIGINSSDDYVNLPPRAISLFESEIKPDEDVKVEYNFRGILGTLPLMNTGTVGGIYNSYMAGTQGIFTDNMYIGDESQYVAFYTDHNGNKQLRIKANQVMYEVTDSETGEVDYHDVATIETEGVPGPPGPAGQDAIRVEIDPIGGNFIKRGQVGTSLIAHVYEGINDITNQFSHFTWYRRKPDGTRDPSWSTQETSNQLAITTADIDESAVFVCEVTVTR
jgi:hypothetical protein